MAEKIHTIGPHTISLREKRMVAVGTPEYVFDKPSHFDFTPGQYVIMDIPEGAVKDERPTFRSLSIASAPYEDVLRFAVRNSESGFKKSLEALAVGDTVEIKGPLGHFLLPEDKDAPVVLLIGGIGITPARSMIMQEAHEKSDRCISLFYANRSPALATYLEELSVKNVTLKNYTCVNTMESVDEAEQWSGETGYICLPMVSKHCGDQKDAFYYIVGTGPFIDAMKQMLTDCGTPDDHIVIDNFGKYGK